jgi:hypothetical protein
MPEISHFFGIAIAMFFSDHPPPHFHARYAGPRAIVAIETFAILEGGLSPRVLGLVVEWPRAHRDELMENWRRARRMDALIPIPPLA